MAAHDPERERAEPFFSLVLPTYNAAAFLDDTCAAVARFLREVSSSWEVVFVCDGCTDGSAARLEKWAADVTGVRVLSYGPNRGKGYAVRRGLAAARGQWRIFTDVDLAYGFADVLRVAEQLQAGADVAIASRVHPDSRLIVRADLQGYAYRRHLQSLGFSALVRCLLPLKQRDTQAGLKGLSAPAARLLLPQLQCNGFGFDCELLVASQAHNLSIVEVPVTMHFDSRVSTTGWRTMRHMIQELWTIRRAWSGAETTETTKPASRVRQRAA